MLKRSCAVTDKIVYKRILCKYHIIEIMFLLRPL